MSELHTNPAPLTQAYADYIAAARSLVLPERAIEVAILGFTDAIGVTLAGAQEEAVLALARWVQEQGGPPVARVFGHGLRVPAAAAALLNATAAHAQKAPQAWPARSPLRAAWPPPVSAPPPARCACR